MDTVIVGGGLAGSTLAILLARAGRRVTVLEKVRFPRDKLCGEFLSPEAELTFERLGVMAQVRALAPPALSEGWFTEARGRSARVPLPGAGLGVRRLVLDAILKEAAIGAGARWFEGEATGARWNARGSIEVEARVGGSTEVFEAEYAIGAYGRHGRLDRALGRARSDGRYVGIKQHHIAAGRGSDLGARVEIHLFDGGYCGVNAVDGDRINVCALAKKRWLLENGGRTWQQISRALGAASAPLARRLAGLQPSESRMLAVSSIDFGRLEPVRAPLLFVGDGAAMIAPLAGDGQSMALRGAERLADIILAGGTWAEVSQRWSRTFKTTFRARLSLGRALQECLGKPAFARALVGVSNIAPLVPAWLARNTREEIPHS